VLGREPVESHRTQDYFQCSRPPTRRESREIAPPPGTTLAPTSGCRIIDSAGVSRPTFSLPLVGCARGTHGWPAGLHAGTCFEITLPTSLVFSWGRRRGSGVPAAFPRVADHRAAPSRCS
jgi:hypothetical protein